MAPIDAQILLNAAVVVVALAVVLVPYLRSSIAKGTRRLRLGVLALLAAVAVGSAYDFSPDTAQRRTTTWDVAHYFLNSKYFDELGYDALYTCILSADYQNGGHTLRLESVRRMSDYAHRDGAYFRAQFSRCQASFSSDRWAQFRSDVAELRRDSAASTWSALLADHGYNGPPPLTLLGRTLFQNVPASSVHLVAKLDLLWVVLGALAIGSAYGAELGLLAIIFLFSSFAARWPIVGQSVLRYEWLACLMGALSLLHRGRRAGSGVLVGMATLFRAFPAALAALVLIREWTEPAPPRGGRLKRPFTVGFGATVVLGTILSAATLGPSAYNGWLQKIEMHASTDQINSTRVGAVIAAMYGGERYDPRVLPSDHLQHRWRGPPDPQRTERNTGWWGRKIERAKILNLPLKIGAVLVWGLVALRARRFRDDELLALGTLLVFGLTVGHPFFYVMMVLPMVVLTQRGTPLRLAALAGFALASLLALGMCREGLFAFGRSGLFSWGLALGFGLWLAAVVRPRLVWADGTALFRDLRERWRARTRSTAVRGKRRKTVALGLVAALVCLPLAAHALHRALCVDPRHQLIHAKYDLLDRLDGTEPVDWLILGGEGAAVSISPAVWTDASGERVLNLSTVDRLHLTHDIWMLDAYIDKVGPPKNILISHDLPAWVLGSLTRLVAEVPRPLGFWRNASIQPEYTPAQLGRLVFRWFLPVFDSSQSLRAHYLRPNPLLDTPRGLHLRTTAEGAVRGASHDAFAINAAVEIRTEKARSRRGLGRLGSAVSGAFGVLDDIAREQDIDVFVMPPAGQADFQRDTSIQNAEKALYDALKDAASGTARIHVMSKGPTSPRTRLAHRVDAVTPEAAPAYTRAVIRAIASHRKELALDEPIPPIRTDFVAPEGIQVERPSEDGTVSLLFGGDTSFARGIDHTIQRAGGDPSLALAQIKPLFDSVDLTFLNLECVLSDSRTQQSNKRWKIRAPTANAAALRDAGVDLVSVANNHTLDFGNQGFSSTLDTLEHLGVAYVGVQYDEAPSQPVTITRIGDQTFGFLAYTDISKWAPVAPDHWSAYWPRPANYDADAIEADIIRAASQVDHLVVSVHWGAEYSMLVEDWQRTAAQRFIDAGAELIVGHHPHVPRLVETYGDGLIIYSLGDFLFDKQTPFKTVRNRRRFMVQIDYTDGQRSDVILHPIHSLDDHLPYVKPDLEVASWMASPIETAWRAVDALPEAVVVREEAGEVAECDTWSTRPPSPRNNGYLQWLRPRWVCPDDSDKPWHTVAVSGDRADGVFKQTIWAHPERGSTLRLRFDEVPLGGVLSGVMGIPDWPLVLAGAEDRPITVSVRVNDAPARTIELPYEAGWKSFSMDTTAWSGTPGTVEVEVTGGSTRETGFGFDLMVEEIGNISHF